MKRFVVILALSVAVPAVAPLAVADPAHDQGEVRKERKKGNVKSLRDIENLVVPTMPGMKYLGPEYDPVTMAYRLKFIRKGRVYFVDVNAQSGKIIQPTR